MAYSRLSYSK